MCLRFGGTTVFTFIVWEKNSFVSLQHPPQLVHYPVDGSSAFLRNVEIFSDCTARKPRRRPPALDEARHLLSVTDRVTLSEWTSSNPEQEVFQQPNAFALHWGNWATVFLEPLLLVCSNTSSRSNSAHFFVTAGCEEFDRNINCVDYCKKQVVNWRFFGTPLKRFIESKRVPLATLPSYFMCVSIGLFWLGCRRMEVHDRCWVDLHTVSEVYYLCEETEEGETFAYISVQMMRNGGVKLLWPSKKKQQQETVHSTVLLGCFYLLYLL